MTDLEVSSSESGDGKYIPDPDRFLKMAKELVVRNYNDHHNPELTPPLETGSLHIVWYTKVLGNWRAIVTSPVIRGLLYEISYRGSTGDAYIEIYRKINFKKVKAGRIR